MTRDLKVSERERLVLAAGTTLRFSATASLVCRGEFWVLGTKHARVHMIPDLNPNIAGTFDLVLCLGVLYHLRDPLGALERVASVARDRLVLETHVDAVGHGRPAMVFYPGAELNQDPSNWWGPNEAALCAMLVDVGFGDPRVVYRDSLARRALSAVRYARRAAPWSTFQQGRVVVHASKASCS